MHKWAADNPQDGVAQSLSGIVLDAGYSFTHAVPVFDGRAQCAAARRIRLGGKLLTNLMKEWVRPVPQSFVTAVCDRYGAQQHVLQASALSGVLTESKVLLLVQVSYRSINLKDEAHLVEHVKEQVCYVAANARAEMARAFPIKRSEVSLEVLLPDGVENIAGIVQDPRDPKCAFLALQHIAFRSRIICCMTLVARVLVSRHVTHPCC